MNEKTIIRARAPLRIGFGGGGTDVSPYSDTYGGLVLNATINRYAYVTIEPNGTDTVVLRSLDYDEMVSFDLKDGAPEYGDGMQLALGVINHLGILERGIGFNLYTHADCPPGSGLGASSTVVVTLIGAFEKWLGLGLGPYDTAHLAYEIERKELGIQGGKQDQYAAAFGGFNFIEFRDDFVLVNPLRISDAKRAELEYSLVLAYTGRSRQSSSIIEHQIKNASSGEGAALEAMHRTKEFASEMKRALLTGHIRQFGELLHEAWLAKQAMSEEISNPFIEKIYTEARKAGALGGKISGAGGGGFMFFFAAFDKRHKVVEALSASGAEVVHFGFTDSGLQSWIR